MELSTLTPAELASANKADAAGVTIEARDNDGNLIENPVIPAAAPVVSAKEKPVGLPDKFWNATTGEADYAGLAKSYTELEKTRGKPAVETPAAPAKSAALQAAEAALAAAQAAEAPARAPVANAPSAQTVTVDAASAEFARDGKLAEATYDSLAKTGLSRGMVDSYIAGQQSQQTAAVAEIHASVGGPENYKSMTDWARVNWTPQQINDYDVGTTSPSTVKLAVADLYSKYQAANGRDGNLVSGGSNSPGGQSGGYANQSELIAAVSDPRYKKDAAYRTSVEAKMGRTADNIL